jgi:hypothetical protein
MSAALFFFFRSLLSENQHREKHHIVHLNGVSGRHMQQLLAYMYRGEISICQVRYRYY